MVSSSRSSNNDDALSDESIRVVDTALQVAFAVPLIADAAKQAQMEADQLKEQN